MYQFCSALEKQEKEPEEQRSVKRKLGEEDLNYKEEPEALKKVGSMSFDHILLAAAISNQFLLLYISTPHRRLQKIM
jgi:hypothetical protein